MSEYVTKLDNGAYRIVGTRISLGSVVYAFNRGELPETIARKFPALDLNQIYGAIAFYLSNKQEIDDYLQREEVEYEKMRQAQRETDPKFYARFDRLREGMKKRTLSSK